MLLRTMFLAAHTYELEADLLVLASPLDRCQDRCSAQTERLYNTPGNIPQDLPVMANEIVFFVVVTNYILF